MSEHKHYVIANDVSDYSRLEMYLYNLQLRLRIQEDMVAKTKSEIELVEELIELEKKTE